MDECISIGDFALAVHEAAVKYPGAVVASVGTGRKDDHWYHVIILGGDRREIRVEIPAYKEGGKRNDT